ncbi:MAG: M15 family metallopeptidase [Flavobacterium sp.]|nr:M15 family metallopeptidase [Flavobacterium sp.]
MKQQYIITMLAIAFLLGNNRSAAQLANTLPKNEFGLTIVSNAVYFKASITQDSLKQMVAIDKYVAHVKTNFVYATTSNFTHKILYSKPKAYLRLAAVKALQAVANNLKTKGLGLLIYDAYRPYSVTKTMWQIVPDDRYAANPAKGSGHNRGIAVDVTLYNLQTGMPLPMPTPFDDFTEKAHHNYRQLDSTVLANRQLLKTVMEQQGFKALDTEWWHYYLPNAAYFELLDIDFKQMKKLVK